MALQFPSLVKGRVSESLLITLLERAGYRVTRMGVEELFAEIKLLEHKEYLALNLPEQLRLIPDLLVAAADMTQAFLVEVKFRRRLTDDSAAELHQRLVEQRRFWPQSYAVILLGCPFVESGRFHQDYIRVVAPGQEGLLLKSNEYWPGQDETARMQQLWDGLPQLQQVFRSFYQGEDNQERGFTNQQNADLITQTLSDLSRL